MTAHRWLRPAKPFWAVYKGDVFGVAAALALIVVVLLVLACQGCAAA